MKIALILALGALAVSLGTGMVVTNFTTYLGDDPTTCNNCHVMDAVYEGWYHAGHRGAAACNDCHVPHSFFAKYFVKARSGFNHVSAFTIGHVPEPLRAKESTDHIIQDNCLRCHSEAVSMIADGQADSGRYCFDCHRVVAHGERGISLLPYQDKQR